MKLEVCTEGIDMSVAAAKAGATRLELCSSLASGGLTPSAGVIQQVCGKVSIPVHVMIRPRSGDFLYSQSEFESMLADVHIASRYGASGIVFGILDRDGMIDLDRCKRLMDEAGSMVKVFHRAFDMSADPYRSLDDLKRLGVDILLTSGRRQTAIEGMEVIRQLVHRSDGQIEIMAGSGVNPTNAVRLASTGVHALHFTSKKTGIGGMLYKNAELQNMGSSPQDEYSMEIFDADKFNAISNAVAFY